jgi:hypothetical protein
MPPQQAQHLLDFGNGLLDFRTHALSSKFRDHVVETAAAINPYGSA